MPVANGQITILDLNDALLSGTPPRNPVIGTLWIDATLTPNVLKSWNGTTWVPQTLEIGTLDPGFHQDVENLKTYVGKASNDGFITTSEKLNVKLLLVQITGDTLTTNSLPTIAAMTTSRGGEVYLTRAAALAAGVLLTHADFVAYDAAYNDLKAYLELMTPRPWVAGDTVVVPATWMTKWDTYYEKLARLQTTTSEKLATRISDAETSLSVLPGQIAAKVSQTEVDSSIAVAKSANHGYRYYEKVVVYGDSNLYYPVIIKGGDQNVKRDLFIKRGLSEQGPDDWNTATHKGALTVKLKTNFGGWGGANYSWEVHELEEMYSKTFAGAVICGNSVMFAVFLRGGGIGGAAYHIYSDQQLNSNTMSPAPIPASPQVAYAQEKIFESGTYLSYAPAPRSYTQAVIDEIALRNFIKLSQSLESRVNTAEQKITADAIVSTVTKSTTYTNELGAKVSTNKVISSINQTAELIKISAEKLDIEGKVKFSSLEPAAQVIVTQGSTSYWLVTNAAAIQKSAAGVYTPSSLSVTAKSKVGTGAPLNYAARFKIHYSTDGTAYTLNYTSAADEAVKSYAVPANVKAVKIEMYQSGGTTALVDEITIPIVLDGSQGAQGNPGLKGETGGTGSSAVALSLELPDGSTFQGNNGNPKTINVKLREGITDVTANATLTWYFNGIANTSLNNLKSLLVYPADVPGNITIRVVARYKSMDYQDSIVFMDLDDVYQVTIMGEDKIKNSQNPVNLTAIVFRGSEQITKGFRCRWSDMSTTPATVLYEGINTAGTLQERGVAITLTPEQIDGKLDLLCEVSVDTVEQELDRTEKVYTPSYDSKAYAAAMGVALG